MSRNNLIYTPFRNLGVICGDVPPAINKLGDDLFFTVAAGNVFQVYRADRLQVVLVSKPAPGTISHICTSNHDTFVSVENIVYRYRRAHLMNQVMQCSSAVKGLLCLGEALLCYDDNNSLLVYSLKTMTVVATLKMLHSARITFIQHPATYLNKFLIGYDDGQIELWNIKSGKQIYVFQSVARRLNASTSSDSRSITAMTQSPASDIIAVGFASGDVMVINIKLDVVLFHFRQKGEITAISFRADLLTSKFPYILTSSIHGDVYVWSIENLNNEAKSVVKLLHTIHAHNSRVISLQFLPSEPVFLTSGSDNALKLWIFDNPDGSARLLKYRQGLSKYPKKLRYFGDLSSSQLVGQEIYSIISGMIAADADGRLLFTRTEKDYDFQELSSRSLDTFSRGRLPECIDFDFTYIGSKPWGDLVSVHKDKSDAYLWKVEDKAATKTILRYVSEGKKSSFSSASAVAPSATAVKLSSCGNFAVIGYSNGLLGKFNIQSGLSRGQFNDSKWSGPVVGKVNGLYLDSANITLISIHEHGYLIFWDFQTLQLKHIQHLPSRLLKLEGTEESNFIAVADADGFVRLYDIETLKICRIFQTNHSANITDLLFTIDCRRLLTCSLDQTLQVWDISTSQRISWCQFSAPLTSIAFTSSGDLLVAKHNQKDITLCADRSLVEGVEHVASIDAPIDLTDFSTLAISQNVAEEAMPEKHSVLVESRQEDGLTLSSVSKSYWTSLCNMELLQKRNKLIRPVEKVSIPFFIPLTTSEIDEKGKRSDSTAKSLPSSLALDSALVASKNSSQPISRILKRKTVYRAKILELLHENSVQDSAFKIEFLAYLMSLTPSELDIQLQNLLDYDQTSESDTTDIHAIQQFFAFLEDTLQTRRNFELIQAVLHRILVVHASALVQFPPLLGQLLQVQSAQSLSGQSLQNMLHLTLCLTKSLLSIPIS